METKIKQAPIERFVRAYVKEYRKTSTPQRFIDIAIRIIDAKLGGAKQLRVYPGQYSQLTMGVQYYLNSTPLNGNRQSIERAKVILQNY